MGMACSIIITWNNGQPYVSPYGTASRAMTVGMPSRLAWYPTSTSPAIFEIEYVGIPGMVRWLSPTGDVSVRGSWPFGWYTPVEEQWRYARRLGHDVAAHAMRSALAS